MTHAAQPVWVIARHADRDGLWLVSSEGAQLRVGPAHAEARVSSAAHRVPLGSSHLAGAWRHFKGGRYTVVGEAIHRDDTIDVLYVNDVGEWWLRARDEWEAHIERDGYQGPRFYREAAPAGATPTE